MKNSTFPLALLIVFIITSWQFQSCEKADNAKKPMLESLEVYDIAATTAKSGGTITADGGADITTCGVVASTAPDPTINSNQFISIDHISNKYFTSGITNLQPNTTYYLKAYATNEAGTGYGNQVTFKTLDGIASISTNIVMGLSKATAKCTGEVIADGGSIVTHRGIVWNTSSNPTNVNNLGMVSEEKGVGTFSFNLTGLNQSTTYHLRAFVTNSVGTYYSDEVCFSTFQVDDGTLGSITYNNYTYQTVWIGNREWMAENLRTTKYRDGSEITTNLGNTAWSTTTSGAYSVYPYNGIYGISSSAEMVIAYGLLYNFHAVNDSRNLSPVGWHVPTKDDWMELINYLELKSYFESIGTIAGDQLKSCRQVSSPLLGTCSTSSHPRWDANGFHWGTNIYGFSALPSGFRHQDGSYGTLGYSIHMWSSTENSATEVWRFYLYVDAGEIAGYQLNKNFGLAVRCIRDK